MQFTTFSLNLNFGPVRFVNWMRIPDAASARSNWIQQSDVVRSRFWKFWIFGWACCSWKRSNISSRNPKKSGWVFKINLDAASNLTSYFAPNEHRSASASGCRVQFTKRTRPPSAKPMDQNKQHWVPKISRFTVKSSQSCSYRYVSLRSTSSHTSIINQWSRDRYTFGLWNGPTLLA